MGMVLGGFFWDADPMEILWMSPTKRVLQILESLNLLQWEVYLGNGKINNGYIFVHCPGPIIKLEPGGSGLGCRPRIRDDSDKFALYIVAGAILLIAIERLWEEFA